MAFRNLQLNPDQSSTDSGDYSDYEDDYSDYDDDYSGYEYENELPKSDSHTQIAPTYLNDHKTRSSPLKIAYINLVPNNLNLDDKKQWLHDLSGVVRDSVPEGIDEDFLADIINGIPRRSYLQYVKGYLECDMLKGI